MKRNNTIEELSTKGYVYQTFVEAKEGTTVFDGIDEAIDNAIDATDKGGSIYVIVDNENNKVQVLDDGCGMTHTLLKDVMQNATFHKADGKSIGINGIGIKKFAAIVGNLRGCRLNVLSSKGDGYVSSATLHISPNDEEIIHPTIEWFENGNLPDNGMNIINGKLKGTIATLTYTEEVNFTDDIIEQYSIKYAEQILLNKKHIFINGKELVAIDPTHTIGINDINKDLIVDEENRLYIANFKLEAFIEGQENIKIPFIVTSVQALDPSLLRKKYPFENKPFNYLGGIYTIRGGRFIDYGNNTNIMFAMESSKLGSIKGSGMYGDISGSLAGYNRLIINLDNMESARLFGVQSIKSKGIIPLHENDNLFKYKVNVNGVKITVFEAISYIRCFNHKFYTTTIKSSKYNWKNFREDVYKKFYEYDFSTSKQIKKSVTSATAHKSKNNEEAIYTIADSVCYLKVQWKQNAHNDKAKIVYSLPNEDCLLYRRNKENVNLISKLTTLFIEDFKCFADYAHYDREGIKNLLIARTNQYLDKMKEEE